MNKELKIYTSPRQSAFIGMTTKETKYQGNRTITVEGDEFSIELPDNKILTGTLIFQQSENGKDTYLTDTGCPIAFSEEQIFLNLYQTHDCAITFDLRKEEPKKSFFKKIFG